MREHKELGGEPRGDVRATELRELDREVTSWQSPVRYQNPLHVFTSLKGEEGISVESGFETSAKST